MAMTQNWGYLQTGLRHCYDVAGDPIPCAGTGQDAEFRHGHPLPAAEARFRFAPEAGGVVDQLTGLVWLHNANPAEFPLTWAEAFSFVAQMNRDEVNGQTDWRLPNRVELRSLCDLSQKNPVLPAGHPFQGVENAPYWSATTAVIRPAHAWTLSLDGGRMFYGHKEQFFLLWPVRGTGNGVLRVTGQRRCFETDGTEVSCAGTGQDGKWRLGRPWPQPRFVPVPGNAGAVQDRLTGLVWRRQAELSGSMTWEAALAAVRDLNDGRDGPWRLPNINELESLVDADRADPALPVGHGFEALHDTYWSSTTSVYEPDWAWALYLTKGAVGVGRKRSARFHVWPVAGPGALT